MTKITNLTCERFLNPLAIDSLAPRFSWQMESARDAVSQTAYEVRVGSTPGGDDLWNSGRVGSDASVSIRYEGKELGSRVRAFWQVTVWDEIGEAAESGIATFQMGLLSDEDWEARWIGGQVLGGPRTVPPVSRLRKEWDFPAGVAKATLYLSGLGIYEAFLNGKPVGEAQLAPGWTDYRKRVRYQAYNIKDLLNEGANCLGALVADGWFSGFIAWKERRQYGASPLFLAQLEIETVDGERQVFASDGSWRSGLSEILAADFLIGETQDLTLAERGWSEPGFDDSGWSVARIEEWSAKRVAQASPPITCQEIIAPVSTSRRSISPNSKVLYDFGQNLVGRVRVRATGKPGDTLSLGFAERLTKVGALYTENYRSAKSTDYVTLTGASDELFDPKFTFHGFQYLEMGGVDDLDENCRPEAVVIHSDCKPIGHFECSDPLLNQLFHNIRWGWKGNSLDVPTDCPQRDERLGWTGDAQAFVRTACYLSDVQTFFEKYEQDLEDSQNEVGQIPMVAPDPKGLGEDGGPAWADAFVICPWTVYRCFGDPAILRNHYPALQKWLDSLTISSKDHIRSYPAYEGFKGFGDWLSTNAETPIDLIGTAFYAHSAFLMSQIATVLELPDDARRYKELCEQIKQAFRDRFVTKQGLVASGSQTSYVLALHFDLLPDHLRQAALQLLVDDIGGRKWKLSTGFVGTPYLLHVLTKGGRLDVAYKLLLQREWPSWLYPVTQGATTIWERWDGWTEEKGFQDPGMNSFNHYAYGAVGDWLFSTVAGIDLDPTVPGYKRSLLQPKPGGDLSFAKATLETPYGLLSSEWFVDEKRFTWNILVPPNATAEAVLPYSGTRTTLRSGRHTLEEQVG